MMCNLKKYAMLICNVLIAIIILSMSLKRVTAAGNVVESKGIVEIIADYECKTGVLSIDAKVEENLSDWKKGTLNSTDISADKLKYLYGEPEKWNKVELLDEPEYWKYGSDPIYVKSNEGNISFDNEMFLHNIQKDESTDYDIHSEKKALETASDILKNLGISAKATGVVKRKQKEMDGEYYPLRLVGMLDGKEIAALTEGNQLFLTNLGELEFLNGKLVSLNFHNLFKTEREEEANLLPVDKILGNVMDYAKNGWLAPTGDEQKITEIKLQYYVDWKENHIEFYPVWVFFVPNYNDRGILGTGLEGYFYIDAQTGELLQYQEYLCVF